VPISERLIVEFTVPVISTYEAINKAADVAQQRFSLNGPLTAGL